LRHVCPEVLNRKIGRFALQTRVKFGNPMLREYSTALDTSRARCAASAA
jgi:hypothetical protein